MKKISFKIYIKIKANLYKLIFLYLLKKNDCDNFFYRKDILSNFNKVYDFICYINGKDLDI